KLAQPASRKIRASLKTRQIGATNSGAINERARARALPDPVPDPVPGTSTIQNVSVVGAPRARETHISEQLRDELTAHYAPLLGGAERVRASIAKALTHKASDSSQDSAAGLNHWLAQDVADRAERAPIGRRPQTDLGRPDGDDWLARLDADARAKYRIRTQDKLPDLSGCG